MRRYGLRNSRQTDPNSGRGNAVAVDEEERSGVIAAHVLHVWPQLEARHGVLRVEDLRWSSVSERLDSAHDQHTLVGKQHRVNLIARNVELGKRLPHGICY